EYAATEVAHEPVKRRCPEGKESQRQIDGVMVVEELQSGALRDLMADSHLADCGRTNDEEEDTFHIMPAPESPPSSREFFKDFLRFLGIVADDRELDEIVRHAGHVYRFEIDASLAET